MKKMLLSALIAGSMIAGTGVALADKPAEPGREHGMCTAFFNGKKKGHGDAETGGAPGPFQELYDNADDGDDDNGSGLQDLFNSCNEVGIGGNPDENGRFTTCWSDDDGTSGDDEVPDCDD